MTVRREGRLEVSPPPPPQIPPFPPFLLLNQISNTLNFFPYLYTRNFGTTLFPNFGITLLPNFGTILLPNFGTTLLPILCAFK